MAFESGGRAGEVSTGTTIMAVAFDGGVVGNRLLNLMTYSSRLYLYLATHT